MIFEKGSKVEVLNNREVSSGEWRCAQILSGNGHTYSVQYDCSSMTSEPKVERVLRKAIRPCPPLVKGVESWAANDFVEVYDAGCWKRATVLKFLRGDIYLVRLLGSCKVLSVHKSNMRVCQSWQDDQWVLMRKNCEAGKSIRNLSLKARNSYKMSPRVQQAGTEVKQQNRNKCSPGQDSSSLQESRLVSSTTLKRASPYCSSAIEAYPNKVRAIMNKGECQRFVTVPPAPLLEKVDAVAYPQNMGEKCMHSSFYNGSTRFYKMGNGNPNNVTTHFLERMEEPNDSGSDMCSVGSCSVISNIPSKLSSDMLAAPCQDANTFSSDAESLDVRDEEERCPLSPKENVTARIHRLELNAYCSTLEAMYASGPLSWEQEALLTNLRISLHISNDEHLTEIRNLISAGQRI